MSALGSLMPGGSSGTAVSTPQTADSGIQAITPGGSTDPNWINSLKTLGYTPNGTSWGNIGTMQPTSLLTSLGQPAPLKTGS